MTFEDNEYILNIYKGILFNNAAFRPGEVKAVTYRMDCPEYAELRDTYHLEQLAGKGSDLQRSIRLLQYLSPRLTHSAWYDNHIECNALRLLGYSLDNPEHGINCRNKSKVLEECCLALGIYARRVRILPYSPYDLDCHVVTEIYDRKAEKWFMLDPTTNGCLVDENFQILSIQEARSRLATDQFVTFWKSTARKRDARATYRKNIEQTQYFAKNLFRIQVDAVSQFGETGEWYEVIPEHYSVCQHEIGYAKYMLRYLSECDEDSADFDIAKQTERAKKMLEEALKQTEPTAVSAEILTDVPQG